MLGEEGSIEIYADQTKIGTINKETEEVEGKYVLDISKADSNKVSIKTSKPITEGEFVIDIEKAIKEEIDYGKSQMQEFVQIKTKVEEKENEGIEARAEKTIELKEVVSQAELSISKADLTTVVKNEDVKIRAYRIRRKARRIHNRGRICRNNYRIKHRLDSNGPNTK